MYQARSHTGLLPQAAATAHLVARASIAAATLLSLLIGCAAGVTEHPLPTPADTAGGAQQVLVVFPWESFGCSIITPGSSSTSGHASSSSSESDSDRDVPSASPVVYIRYEPAFGSNWIVQQMHVAWWNSSLVLSTIPRGRQFVVLCVGMYLHCDTTPEVVNSSSFGVCVKNSWYSNFFPTASSVFIHPTVAGYGVLGPFCELSNSFWSAAADQPFVALQDVFTPFGSNVPPRTLNTTAPDPVPCLGNGHCIVNLTGNVTGVLQLSAKCKCRGNWSADDCSRCNCEAPAEPSCMTISGSCTANAFSNSTAAPVNHSATVAQQMAQGVVIVLLHRHWYRRQLNANQTQVRFNTGNISFNAVEWDQWFMQGVDVNSPRWGGFDASPYSDGSWLMAVLPGNLAQFVFYNAVIGDYIHCTNDQVISGITDALWNSSSNDLAIAELEGTFQCVGDQVNTAMNFAAVASIVAVSENEFRVLRTSETGCQYGFNDGPNGNTALLCSGHGTCNRDTYFRCQCPGNYTGVACEACNCPSGAMCDGLGQCVCSPGFDLCHGGSWCTNVTNDVKNCGGCGNDCTAGIGSAVRYAACEHGTCVVEMVNPMDWLLCFGGEAEQQSDSNSGGSHSSSTASDASTVIVAPSVSCFRGFDFAVVLAVSFPLFAVSMVAFCRLRWQHGQTHKHRQALFVLLALIGGLRASYSIVALLFLATARTPDDAVRSRQFFAATMITLNAYADLFAGFIDVLLTVYWLFVLDRIQVFPQRLLLVGCACMAATLTVASVVDYCTTDTTFVYTFFTLAILLFFTAMMHMIVVVEVFTKFLAWHRAGVTLEKGGTGVTAPGALPGVTPASTTRAFISPRYVAVDGLGVNGSISSSPAAPLTGHDDRPTGSTLEAGNCDIAAAVPTSLESPPRREQRNRGRTAATTITNVVVAPATPRALRTAPVGADEFLSLPQPAPRRQTVYVHFLRVTMIAFVCLVCWMVRSVMLLGRATKTPIFYTGALSFNNPTFTLVYLTLLTLFPCMVIALIWVGISFDLLRIATGATAQQFFEQPPAAASRSISMTEKSLSGATAASQESTPLLRGERSTAALVKGLGEGPSND